MSQIEMELVSPRLVRLDFEDLTAFSCVTEQYRHAGVRFSGAIAIHPSNPAFPAKSGSTVLMPVGNLMTVSAYFDKPSCWVGAFACGSNVVVLTAYDRNGNVLDRTSTSPETGTEQSPPLELNRHGIARVEFRSSLPFILDDFFFTLIP